MATRKQMVEFLTGHFRYSTMNSWNGSSSYAARVKLRHFVPSELMDAAYSMLEMREVFCAIEDRISEWTHEHDGEWTAGFNGRSGGYLVLYRSEYKPTEHKSYCPSCGQRNFQTAAPGSDACGVCHKAPRVNYEKAPRTLSVFSGKDVDRGETFEDWAIEDIRARYALVRSFCTLVHDCKAIFLGYARGFTVEEKTVTVPKTIKVLREKV